MPQEAPTPRAVESSMRLMGEHFSTWRKLRKLTAAELADRAGVGVKTVQHLEAGGNVRLEMLLRIARALGVLELLTTAVDPYESDLGRLHADKILPTRVRHRRGSS